MQTEPLRIGWVREGFADLGRRLSRCWLWAQEVRCRRRLRLAEIELGKLAWMRAEYEGDAVRVAGSLNQVEREQAVLLAQSGETAKEIEALETSMPRSAEAHAREIGLLSEHAGKAVRTLATERENCAEFERKRARFAAAVSDLDRAIAAAEADFVACAQDAGGDTAEMREAAARRDRLLREQGELSQLVKANAAAAATAMDRAAAAKDDSAARQETLAAAHARRAAEEANGAASLQRMNADKARTLHTLELFEKKKETPFLELGRCLADSGIGPDNQPQVLDQVVALREQIAALAIRRVALRAESAAAPRDHLVLFYGVLAVAITLALAIAHWCTR